MNGEGYLHMISGDDYTGKFINGLFHGLGTLTSKDGAQYKGLF